MRDKFKVKTTNRIRIFKRIDQVTKYVNIKHPGTFANGDGIIWQFYRIGSNKSRINLGNAWPSDDGNQWKFEWFPEFEPNFKHLKIK